MDTKSIQLDPKVVEAIARKVVELLDGQTPRATATRLADAAAVAERLGVDREWVYAHADQLGAIRLGGPHGRLRFDLEVVSERLGGADATSWRPPKRAPRRPASRGRNTPLKPPVRKLESVPITKSGRAARKRPRPDTGG
jgi:hypothetical protein